MCNVLFFLIMLNVEVQTNWVGGPGVLGPVDSWGSFFYQCDSVSYNIEGRILPVATDIDYSAWVTHIIESNSQSSYLDALVYGDFDNDDNVDIVGARNDLSKLTFYKNLGTSFTPIASYTLPYLPTYGARLSVADVNGDGLLDVISAGNGVRCFKNFGNFNFSSDSILSGEYLYCVTGDIDNDTDIDIVVSGPGGDGPIYILKNDGLGTFTTTQTLSYENWRLYLSDVTGDGYLDLLSNEWFARQIRVYKNDGLGNFSSISYWSSYKPDGLWGRDIDNDGDADIMNCECAVRVKWWQNSGDGINYTPHLVYSGSEYGDAAFTEDMDIDGKADIVSGLYSVGFFRQLTWDSFTTYRIDTIGETHWVYPLYRGKCFQTVDVIVSDYVDSCFLWYENNMVNQFTPSGWLESSILNSNCKAKWQKFGYEVCCPFDGAITLQFRTGNNLSDITTTQWSSPISLPGLGYYIDSLDITPYVGLYDTLFQYRVNFLTSGRDAPIVYEVWVEWDCEGSGIVEQSEQFPSLLTVKSYNGRIYYSLPVATNIHISLYDISGRLVDFLYEGYKSAGNHSISVPPLPAGVYFIDLRTDSQRKVAKFIVLHAPN